jgi:hypothetical protein
MRSFAWACAACAQAHFQPSGKVTKHASGLARVTTGLSATGGKASRHFSVSNDTDPRFWG